MRKHELIHYTYKKDTILYHSNYEYSMCTVYSIRDPTPQNQS